MHMEKRFYLETFGCQMNVVDSERIVDLLRQIGYRQVDAAAAADLILLNTCAVRDKAVRKAYGHLGRFKPLKDENPALILGVGGCVAQQEGEKMLAETPYLDIVFGTHNIHKLPEMVLKVEGSEGRFHETEFLDKETRLTLFPNRSEGGEVCRFVTIMQGCDNFCTYCVVPHVRGREISRPSAEILDEVRGLAADGMKEVTLIGQNVNSYGIQDERELSFAALLRAVADIDGIERIRFTTSHPKDMSDELIACFADLDKLCHHIHLPVQCGSNSILKSMNRGYSREEYLELVEKLRQACPDIRFSTDIIVGFPGESEADFEQTLDLVEQVRYADAFTFLYSPRPGTAAAEMEETLAPEVKQARFDRLIELQQQISETFWQDDVGKVLPVLVEGESKQGEGQYFGRTTWNRIVNFPGSPKLVGRTVMLRIVKNFRNSQLGEIVSD